MTSRCSDVEQFVWQWCSARAAGGGGRRRAARRVSVVDYNKSARLTARRSPTLRHTRHSPQLNVYCNLKMRPRQVCVALLTVAPFEIDTGPIAHVPVCLTVHVHCN